MSKTGADLAARRREILEERFAGYDFGCRVEDADGWETETPETEWSRAVYLENETDPLGATLKSYYVVRFALNSPVVVEEYAILSGAIFGNPTTEANTSAEIFEVLGRVPVDDDGRIQTGFLQFGLETPREDIWHWLEARDPQFSVHAAQFPNP